jgi:hypothetical protein
METKSASVERIIRPKKGFVAIDFGEPWRYRELFLFLAWRDILVRYKQTAIGILWAVIQPFMIMIVFTVIFGGLAKFPSNGVPYAVMTFAAVLPWQFFATAMGQGAGKCYAERYSRFRYFFLDFDRSYGLVPCSVYFTPPAFASFFYTLFCHCFWCQSLAVLGG